ncbi:GNAT family N-acetyltransferase [Paenibacillus senegalensis]|uniref:GNAT family N-acetyltransferase n=1 Tax=Paenibacillus senegalensis TaxID=1465766 RepID=UPI000287E3B4|nr:GNAT family N-acetyltransferase [Paenibacillus senegalensis]
MKIMQVTAEDQLRECLAIRREVFVYEQQVPPELEKDEYDALSAACIHLLAVDGGQPVGTARWVFYDKAKTTAKFQRLAVHKAYRGSGLGRQMIQALERSAAKHGARSAILNGQLYLETFYEKLGYVNISKEPFLDAGIWHLQFKKSLKQE